MSRTTLYRLFHRDGGVAAFIQLVNNHAYQETTGHVLQLGLAGVNWPTRADAANAATNALPQQLRNQRRREISFGHPKAPKHFVWPPLL
jgi:hypothetical protein